MIVSKEIRRRIVDADTNKIYSVGDFADLQNDAAVTRALSRLAEDGTLIRIAQGLYLYPNKNRFGVQKPDLDQIAIAIAEKDQSKILPSGLTALNALGLSTQVTTNAVYITDGTPRTLSIGNRTITFKKGVPRYFAFCSLLFATIVLAMKELGEKNITDETLNKIQGLLSMEQSDKVEKDMLIAPQWIRKVLINK